MSGKSDIRLMRAVFKVASEIIDCKDTVTIDSGIYGHYWLDSDFEVAKDLIILSPLHKNGIGYDDFLVAFNYMMSQFKSFGEYDRSYVLDEVLYDSDEKKITLIWGELN